VETISNNSVFNGNNEIINNSYEDVDYTNDRFTSRTLSINPMVSDNYKETSSEDLDEVYNMKQLEEALNELYMDSPWYSKYKQNIKKIEKADISEIYYYFKERLVNTKMYSIVHIFCSICEFFDFNYKNVYNDIISIKDKAAILEALEERYGLENQFSKAVKLF
jgi:hypothetical protein